MNVLDTKEMEEANSMNQLDSEMERFEKLHLCGDEEDDGDEDGVAEKEYCGFCRGRGCLQCFYRGYWLTAVDELPN